MKPNSFIKLMRKEGLQKQFTRTHPISVSQIIMLQEFLRQYPNAVDLDDSRFDTHFPEGIQRSDFLLFDRLTICELKEIRNIDIRKQVEYLLEKYEGKCQGFKRIYTTQSV